MVTTRHFRDVIEIRRGTKPDLWDAYNDVAPPYIRRRDRFEVTERIDHAGEVVTTLDEQDVRRVAAILRRRGVQTVAVCFINAHANPAHELRVREILEEELPGVTVSTSAEVLPEIFEHERFSTTVANAVLSPLDLGLREPAPAAARRAGLRRRRAASPLGWRRDDAEAGGAVRRTTRCVRDCRRRDREPPHRDSLRLPERDRLRHGRHVDRRLARLQRRGASHQGVVRRVRLSDLLSVDRGADDRRRRRLVRLDRRGRLAAERPPIGRRTSRSSLLWARQRPANEHRREPRARTPRRGADRRRDAARPGGRGARDLGAHRGSAGLGLVEAADAIIRVANANMADACG